MPAFHLLWTMGSYLLPFVFVLSLVVFCHEMGHFLVGRWCGVKVDAFSLGFGPEIAHYIDRHGTRWRLAALPLGGYVRFHGDANAASEPNFDANAAMPDSERAAAFFAQKVWKRAAVVAAGPIANFVLALVIFTGLSIGTLFTLFVVPAMYMFLAGEHQASAEPQAGAVTPVDPAPQPH